MSLWLRIAVLTDEEDRRVGRLAREKVKTLNRRLVRPLEILEDDKQRLMLSEAGKEGSEASKKSCLEFGRICVPEAGIRGARSQVGRRL